ncbi:uncharacterized protein Osi15 [Fopius arisanus]|uniref:Uncharacterized protein Osi15 n=2 Tax=Fopius arisanus TaxID=64838 RepID=A0A9R1TRM4_9HYME|nr:PREDICTED: uncharacterized protein LOC105273595 [Fopius arisanus]
MTRIVIFLCLLALVCGNPAGQGEDVEKMMMKKMEELKKTHSLRIYGDIVTLEKLQDAGDQRSLPGEDPLVASIDQFLSSRKIRISLPSDGSPADFLGRAIGQKEIDIELRGLTYGASEARTKLKRMLLPVLLALKLKALIILPIVITMIALIGLKGLGAGLAALFLSGAVALKAILTPPPYPAARVSYGIVKPEIHHDHWHRSQEEVNQPYRGWSPEFNDAPYPYQDLP